MSLIPYVLPPLHRLRVLVTRPEPQATRLADALRAQGAEPIVFPGLAIRRIEVAAVHDAADYQWLLFLSAHAVEHSSACLRLSAGPRVAAIGRATAAALQAKSCEVHVVPHPQQTSEALLAHADFKVDPGSKVLIVRGAGGRNALDEALTARGARVDSLIVYERVAMSHPQDAVAALEREWAEAGIDVVTATSGDTLAYLYETLSSVGRSLLGRTPLAVVSPRVAARAGELGFTGEYIVAPNAEDAAIAGALANWAARAR